MTYVVNDEEKDTVVPLLKPRVNNGGVYVELGVSDDCGADDFAGGGGPQQARSPCSGASGVVSSGGLKWRFC